MSSRRLLYLAVLLVALLATRLPFAGGQIFSFDDVNLTYAADEFDIFKSQPQPPGYPLFVMLQRASRLLGFKNPVSNLLWLAMAGAFLSLLAMRWTARAMHNKPVSNYAVLLFLLHPTFWYTTLTSALRVQLALISAVVAGACWRAWKGDVRWTYLSAAALGIGAGIRPELGPLLFPLWLAALIRSGAPPRARAVAVGLLAASVLVWLVPLAWVSGGPVTFFRTCLGYLGGQDTLQGTLFDASWRNTAVWFTVWTFSGWVVLPVLMLLGRGAPGLSREQTLFYALWMLPGVAFALLVHVADPGHTLALLVPATLLLAHHVHRAVEARVRAVPTRWDVLYPAILAIPLIAFPFWQPVDVHQLLLPVYVIASLLVPRLAGPRLSAAAAAGFILAPSLAWSLYLFGARNWFHENPGYFSLAQIRSQADSGISMSNLEHYHHVLAIDDNSIRTIWDAAASHDGPAVVLWERGLTEPRKLAYYARIPVIVLEATSSARPGPPLYGKWEGPRLLEQVSTPAPLQVRLQPGTRMLWMVKPGTPLAADLPRVFPGRQAGDVFIADLPKEPGERRLVDFVFAWAD